MTSEVQNQKHRSKINCSSHSDSNNKQTNYQDQSSSYSRSSNNINNMDNQKKQVAPYKQSVLATNRHNQEDLSDQLNHLEFSPPASSDFTHLAATSDRSQDPSDSPSQNQLQEQQQIDQGDEDQGKHHVGPVMGIFFKVWSLVKVTKVRHHQKMRRQNSEDANQFNYISGDQISGQQQSSLQTNNQQHLGAGLSQQRTQMLEDRHFRRAGSQPAPSSSHRQQPSDLFAPSTFSDRLPQVSCGQQSQQQLSVMSSGTNSTSSGVSSTTSSNLAPTVATQQSTPISSSVRRHLSAYSLLKSTPEMATPSTSSGDTLSGQNKLSTVAMTPTSTTTSKPPTSWTSKIKRSATTVNQTDFSSYVSKYRSSRRSGCSSVVNAQKHVVSAPPVSLAKATPTTHNHGFFRRKLNTYNSSNNKFFTSNKHNMINNSSNNTNDNFTDHSDEYCGGGEDGEDEEEEDGYEGKEYREGEEEEEDDSNDIYSTPNDSIQSVPSIVPVICNNDNKFSNNFAVHQSQVYPIIKSFSANSFGQQQQQQQQQQFKTSSQDANNIHKSSNRFEPIEEFKVINHKTSNESNHFQRQDSSQSNSKRLNGSRFFISSSSSEDSNSPPNQQRSVSRNHNQEQQSDQQQIRRNHHHHHHHHHDKNNNIINSDSNKYSNNSSSSNNEIDNGRRENSLLHNQQASFQLEQHQNKLSIQHGVHYHNPTSNSPTHQAAIMRPDSLILANSTTTVAQASNGAALFLPVSLQTFSPTSTGIMVPSGGTTAAALAAMSPIDTHLNPSLTFSQRARLNLIEHTAGSNSNINCNLRQSVSSMLNQAHYKKSPSLFDFSNGPARLANSSSRFSSRYPSSVFKKASLANGQLFSGLKPVAAPKLPSNESTRHNNLPLMQQKLYSQQQHNGRLSHCSIPNSISLYDYKSISQDRDFADHFGGSNSSHRMSTATTITSATVNGGKNEELLLPYDNEETSSEYKLAQILLESGPNLNAKDSDGYTALMHAVLCDNIPAIKCLIEHQVSLNDLNDAGLSALDLVCSKSPSKTRVEILKILINHKADLDRCRESDGSRLLDRLIHQHDDSNCDKLAFIDCLLQNGAKLGSSTWLAANCKYEIQLRLLRKLCQDGYYLYKKLSIEAAVYRFEYALKRIAELEQQLSVSAPSCKQFYLNQMTSKQQFIAAQVPLSVRQLKYQIYLGLSRCERKRKFYKRALEFAHMAILVDSTAYEGYYSKAHILKDLGDIDDSLIAIDQTSRLVDNSIENIKIELEELQRQQEALLFDGCFNLHDSQEANWIEATRIDLIGNIEYMEDAKKYILRLREEILDDKLGRDRNVCSTSSPEELEKKAFCAPNQSPVSTTDGNNNE